MFKPRFHTALTAFVIASAAVLASCTTTPPPPPPPPPAPAIPPPITLSDTIVQDAAVFQAYMAKAGAIAPDFHSGDDVARALALGDSVSAGQILRGEIAFAAIAALQDPNYVASVRAYAGDASAREQLTATIVANPGYAVAFNGSNTAAGLAMAAVQPQGRKLYDAGAAMKQFAYDVQHQAWSKASVADRAGRLASAKFSGSNNAVAAADAIASLHAAAVGQSPMSVAGEAVAPPYSPVIVRALAVAALAALGEAGDENIATLAPLLSDAPAATCLNTAKLNLYQCLAVARPHYEDIFCLGQHVMSDTGQCVMIASGAPPPQVEAPPPPSPAPAAPPKKSGKAKHRKAK
jgi:hypothetical protein